MNCPICQSPTEKQDSVYINYPTFKCLDHYLKYFDADWSYSYYKEYAVFDDYRIINVTDHRQPRSFAHIQNKKINYHSYNFGLNVEERVTFINILNLPFLIPIPDSKEKLLQQIEMYKLYQ